MIYVLSPWKVQKRFICYNYSKFLLQIQRPDLTLQTHGGGLSNVDLTSGTSVDSFIPSSFGDTSLSRYKQKYPTYDLITTPLEKGLGTHGGLDPYFRTLANIKSRELISTVLSQEFENQTEHVNYDSEALPLSKWIDGGYIREFINQKFKLKITTPLSPEADIIIKNFLGDGIKNLCTTLSRIDEDVLRAEWNNEINKMSNLNKSIFNPVKFSQKILNCREKLVELAGGHNALADFTDAQLCIDTAIKLAITYRNETIDTISSTITKYSSNLMWYTLMECFNRNEEFLYTTDDAVQLKAMFLWVRHSGKPPPLMSGSTALYLSLVALHLMRPVHLENGENEISSLVKQINFSTKVEFIKEYGVKILEKMSPSLVEAAKHRFKTSNENKELYKLDVNFEIILLYAAVNANQNAFEIFFRNVQKLLVDVENVKKLLKGIGELGRNFDVGKQKLYKIFKKKNNDQLKLTSDINWAVESDSYLKYILKDSDMSNCVVECIDIFKHQKTDVNDMNYQYLIKNIKSNYKLINNLQKHISTKSSELVKIFLNSRYVEAATMMILDTLKTDDEVAEKVTSKLFKGKKFALSPLAKPIIDLQVIDDAFNLLRVRYPQWVNQGVLTEEDEKTALGTLRSALRIFLRISYVPNTMEACVQQYLRGRSGKVSSDYQTSNISAEMGRILLYDGRIYKTYDPQGWYHRMREIENRNVSVRVDLQDLTFIEPPSSVSDLQPFLDVQCERRLRSIGGDIVGNSIIKIDSDRYEDSSDNQIYGEMKLQQILSEAKKAQLGKEYWPGVEVKVRTPNGKSAALFSLIDYDRIEKKSKELYEDYKNKKQNVIFVSPTETYLAFNGENTQNKGQNNFENVSNSFNSYTANPEDSQMNTQKVSDKNN